MAKLFNYEKYEISKSEAEKFIRNTHRDNNWDSSEGKMFFYILWKKSRLKSTFLPYHVKKHHSTS